MTVRLPHPIGARVRRTTVLAACVALLAALAPTVAASDPSPTPSTSASPAAAEVQTTTATCGGYAVTVVSRMDTPSPGSPADPPPSLTVTAPDGTVVVRWQGDASLGEKAADLSCADVDGDGRPELLYSEYCGGAHCCYTFVLVRTATPAVELLRVDLRDAWSFDPTQLDASPALELVAADLRLEGMGELPTAVTSPFPRIFAFDGERYVDATGAYPALLRADRKKALRDLATCATDTVATEVADCRKAVGLRIVALDVLLEAGASGISKLPVDAATRAWLVSMRPQVVAALATP
jgi:hypothetical protein